MIFYSSISLSQSKFENGYYIDNSGAKINCKIRYNDWKNNPTEFTIKDNDEAPTKNISISDIKELTIGNLAKYIKAEVDLDTSIDNIQRMDTVKNPKFIKNCIVKSFGRRKKQFIFIY
jgi:hypothetical protein